ncbi:MAG TPA: class I SAM-dependent rRNA methyltransferase [Vicinamibacteria bacterium]|nr:class I SAM-dependent rRNA methyltransferase [Vicinamibacteria bacterium]
MPAIAVVSRRGEGRVQRGHPWVFRSDVARVDGAAPGTVVQVLAASGRPLGYAFYSSRSEITLRVIQRGPDLPPDWLRRKLEAALAWREAVAPGASTCRLVHGEGDGLPSVVVDRYDRWLVVQTLSQAAEALKDQIVSVLVERLAPEGVLERNDPRVRQLEGLEQRVGLLHGTIPDVVEVREDGLRLQADLWRGQKTGLFLDQRENHVHARQYARGRVLDAFSYTGGFALHMAGGAEEVLAVDVSPDALARVQASAALNGLGARVTTRAANVFDLLRDLQERRERFHAIVLDPPAFAKSREAVDKARRGYKEINLRALRLLEPGGTLITCSCSQHVHEEDFEQIVTDAARDAHATVALIEKRRQARDHPVLLGVPETYYLKCFVLRKLG